MKTDAEIRYEGIKALLSSLGDVNAERFIALISRESFDYTKWQRDLWTGKGIEEISKEAMRCREEQSE
jgi:hypothetical protein